MGDPTVQPTDDVEQRTKRWQSDDVNEFIKNNVLLIHALPKNTKLNSITQLKSFLPDPEQLRSLNSITYLKKNNDLEQVEFLQKCVRQNEDSNKSELSAQQYPRNAISVWEGMENSTINPIKKSKTYTMLSWDIGSVLQWYYSEKSNQQIAPMPEESLLKEKLRNINEDFRDDIFIEAAVNLTDEISDFNKVVSQAFTICKIRRMVNQWYDKAHLSNDINLKKYLSVFPEEDKEAVLARTVLSLANEKKFNPENISKVVFRELELYKKEQSEIYQLAYLRYLVMKVYWSFLSEDEKSSCKKNNKLPLTTEIFENFVAILRKLDGITEQDLALVDSALIHGLQFSNVEAVLAHCKETEPTPDWIKENAEKAKAILDIGRIANEEFAQPSKTFTDFAQKSTQYKTRTAECFKKVSKHQDFFEFFSRFLDLLSNLFPNFGSNGKCYAAAPLAALAPDFVPT